MDYRIFAPDKIVMEVELPASKSISNRMLILNALCGGELHNVARCDDTDAMRRALATDTTASGAVATVNIGAAGTAMRFLTAYYATLEGSTVILDGTERMRHRPIALLVDALRRCGADIEYAGEEGFPPLRITGRKLSASHIEIAGNVSSQYISALLMVAPLMGCRTVTLTGEIISLPYITMTLTLMRLMGVDCVMNGNNISIPADAHYVPCDFTVENDWSAASYWLEMQSLLPESRITLKGLHSESAPGDSAVAGIFSRMGGTAPIILDLKETPDLAQTIVVTACLLGRHFHITGLRTLRIKETDRIDALCTQLRRLGYIITAGDDFSLSWNGERCAPEPEPHISTFDDHRMAMAFAPAAVLFPGIVIDDVEVVSKSYPDFWRHLEAAGFTLTPCERRKEAPK
ncbi:MAG: 3-phosphoshikimate 1-carboxyvinyltransferase [Muribaculaceae bacterium]|nr:3-phosphoshikimate 1-carboxyvinyltransferase [Muribaculaceae bacterium]